MNEEELAKIQLEKLGFGQQEKDLSKHLELGIQDPVKYGRVFESMQDFFDFRQLPEEERRKLGSHGFQTDKLYKKARPCYNLEELSKTEHNPDFCVERDEERSKRHPGEDEQTIKRVIRSIPGFKGKIHQSRG